MNRRSFNLAQEIAEKTSDDADRERLNRLIAEAQTRGLTTDGMNEGAAYD